MANTSDYDSGSIPGCMGSLFSLCSVLNDSYSFSSPSKHQRITHQAANQHIGTKMLVALVVILADTRGWHKQIRRPATTKLSQPNHKMTYTSVAIKGPYAYGMRIIWPTDSPEVFSNLSASWNIADFLGCSNNGFLARTLTDWVMTITCICQLSTMIPYSSSYHEYGFFSFGDNAPIRGPLISAFTLAGLVKKQCVWYKMCIWTVDNN
jgi:hypothetical protein